MSVWFVKIKGAKPYLQHLSELFSSADPRVIKEDDGEYYFKSWRTPSGARGLDLQSHAITELRLMAAIARVSTPVKGVHKSPE